METTPLRVIIVDDEPAHAEAIRRALEDDSLQQGGVAPEVTTVATLSQYRAALLELEPDLALVDLNLPDGRAIDILPASAESGPFPVLVMTSHGNEKTAVEALKSGALDYLVKSPEAFAAMPVTMRRALREWNLLGERRRAEAALRENEERYQALVRTVMDGYCVLNGAGRLTEVNDAYCAMLGYSKQALLAMGVEDLCSESDHGRAHMESIRERGWDRFETRHRRADGSAIEVEVSIVFRPGRDEFICFIHDISERKRAENELHIALEKYRILFESFPQGICVTDARGRIVETNRESERLLGLSRDEHLSLSVDAKEWSIVRPDRTLMPSDEFPSVRALRENRRIDNVEMGIVNDAGAITWLSVTAAPIPLEQFGIAVAYGDITARKRGEERIEHLNRVLRAVRTVDQLIVREQDPLRLIEGICQLLVEHRGYVSALIILTDPEGSPLEFAESGKGEAFRSLADDLRRGLVPACCRRARMLPGVFHVKDRSDVCASCPMFADCSRHDAMCIMLRHDGAIHGFMAVSLSQGQGIDSEELELFHGLAGDVAFALHNIDQGKARLRMQEERDRIELELYQSQKMEAIGQLAGGIAHDFNNMLSVILGFSQIGLAELKPEDRLYQCLQQIEKAGTRSAELTRQLLAFSRKQVAEPRVINLNEVIAEQRKMLHRLIGEDLRIEFAPVGRLWNIRIDPSQVDQILTNLAVNARDAIGGVGILAIATANVTLDQTAGDKLSLAPGDYVKLIFSDTGCGMDQATQERIFEPFFTTKGEGKGTGLGLSTVYGIVKQNEGAIQVQSAPGCGTSFTIHLPRNRSEAVQRAERPAELSLSGSETVLIVEDEEQILNLAKVVLERYGYQVLTAGAPEDACEICAACTGEIQLLLTDVVMPTMNGKELQTRLEIIQPGIKTLFMSGYNDEVIAHRGVLDQGIQFLAKPFTVQSLVEKVRAVLDA